MKTIHLLFVSLIVSTLFMTACSNIESNKIIESLTQSQTAEDATEELGTETDLSENGATVIIPEEGDFYGEINWKDGVWLITEQGSIPLQIQEDTKFYNIPSQRLNESQKNIIEEAGVDYLWYGLVSDLSEYLVQGDNVRIHGSRNSVDSFVFIANEIYFNW